MRQEKRNRKRKEKRRARRTRNHLYAMQGPWNKSHTLPCFYLELPLTLGIGSLAVLSLSPSLTFPNLLSLVWFTWAISVFLAPPSAIYQSWRPTFSPPSTQQQFHSFPLSILQQASSSTTNLINWFYSSPSSPCPSLSPTIKFLPDESGYIILVANWVWLLQLLHSMEI